MKTQRLELSIPAFVTSLLLAASTRASADACNEAYVETQQLRRAGKLRSAEQRALACAQDQCSVTVRRDCGAWLEDIADAMPSVVVEARDRAGNELTDVRVFSGDELLAPRLDGKALPIDPGAHELRFEYGGHVETLRLVALEGQAYRHVTVRFPVGASSELSTPDAAAASLTSAPPSPTLARTTALPVPLRSQLAVRDALDRAGDDALDPPREIPLSSYIFGGVGLASLAAFGVLATSGYMTEQDLRKECGRECDAGSVDAVHERYLMADVALAFGVSSLIAAGTLWLLTPARSSLPQQPVPPQPVELGVALRGSQMTLQGRF